MVHPSCDAASRLRVQEMVAFLATPGALAMSLATDIGASAEVSEFCFIYIYIYLYMYMLYV